MSSLHIANNNILNIYTLVISAAMACGGLSMTHRWRNKAALYQYQAATVLYIMAKSNVAAAAKMTVAWHNGVALAAVAKQRMA